MNTSQSRVQIVVKHGNSFSMGQRKNASVLINCHVLFFLVSRSWPRLHFREDYFVPP